MRSWTPGQPPIDFVEGTACPDCRERACEFCVLGPGVVDIVRCDQVEAACCCEFCEDLVAFVVVGIGCVGYFDGDVLGAEQCGESVEFCLRSFYSSASGVRGEGLAEGSFAAAGV